MGTPTGSAWRKRRVTCRLPIRPARPAQLNAWPGRACPAAVQVVLAARRGSRLRPSGAVRGSPRCRACCAGCHAGDVSVSGAVGLVAKGKQGRNGGVLLGVMEVGGERHGEAVTPGAGAGGRAPAHRWLVLFLALLAWSCRGAAVRRRSLRRRHRLPRRPPHPLPRARPLRRSRQRPVPPGSAPRRCRRSGSSGPGRASACGRRTPAARRAWH